MTFIFYVDEIGVDSMRLWSCYAHLREVHETFARVMICQADYLTDSYVRSSIRRLQTVASQNHPVSDHLPTNFLSRPGTRQLFRW